MRRHRFTLPFSRRPRLVAACGAFAALLIGAGLAIVHAQVEQGRALGDFLLKKNADCPRFSSITRYTMTDDCTGLTWSRQQQPTVWQDASGTHSGYTREESATICAVLAPAGMFRLPTTEELLTLVPSRCSSGDCAVGSPLVVRDGRDGADTLVGPPSPYLSDSFANGLFWASSGYATNAAYGRTVNLRTGAVDSPVFGSQLRMNAWCIVNKTPELYARSIGEDGLVTTIYQRTCSTTETDPQKQCAAFIPGTSCVAGRCQATGPTISRTMSCSPGVSADGDIYHQGGNHIEGGACVPNGSPSCSSVTPAPRALYRNVWIGNQVNGFRSCTFVGCESDTLNNGCTMTPGPGATCADADDYTVMRDASGGYILDSAARPQCEPRYQTVTNGTTIDVGYLPLATTRDRQCLGAMLTCAWTPWRATGCVANAVDIGDSCRCTGDAAIGTANQYVRTESGSTHVCAPRQEERAVVRTLAGALTDISNADVVARIQEYPYQTTQVRTCDGSSQPWESCTWTVWKAKACVPNAVPSGDSCVCAAGYSDTDGDAVLGNSCGRAEICGNGIDDDGDGLADESCVSAQVTIADDGADPADDRFSLLVDGRLVGENQLGSTAALELSGLTVGEHTLRSYFTATSDPTPPQQGTARVALSSNIIWSGEVILSNPEASTCVRSSQVMTCDMLGVGSYWTTTVTVTDPSPSVVSDMRVTASTTQGTNNDNGTPDNPDDDVFMYAPNERPSSVTLEWKAPAVGDPNADPDPASAYDVRYLLGTPVTEANWASATVVDMSSNAPGEPGDDDSVWVSGLFADAPYYFGVKALGEPIGSVTPASDLVQAAIRTPQAPWVAGYYNSFGTSVSAINSKFDTPPLAADLSADIAYDWGASFAYDGAAWKKYTYLTAGDYLVTFRGKGGASVRVTPAGGVTTSVFTDFCETISGSFCTKYDTTMREFSSAYTAAVSGNYLIEVRYAASGYASSRAAYFSFNPGYQSGGVVTGTGANAQDAKIAFTRTNAAGTVIASGSPYVVAPHGDWDYSLPASMYSSGTNTNSLAISVTNSTPGTSYTGWHQVGGGDTMNYDHLRAIPADAIGSDTVLRAEAAVDDYLKFYMNGVLLANPMYYDDVSSDKNRADIASGPLAGYPTAYEKLTVWQNTLGSLTPGGSNTMRVQVTNIAGSANPTGANFRYQYFLGYEDRSLYRASDDFSLTQGQRRWSYGDGTGVFGTSAISDPTVTGPYGWSGWKEPTWIRTTGVGSALILTRMSAQYAQPHYDRSVWRRWTAPKAGTISISGLAREVSLCSGNSSVEVTIGSATTPATSATITTGGSAAVTTSGNVQAGDTVTFTIKKAAAGTCLKKIYFDPVILYTSITK